MAVTRKPRSRKPATGSPAPAEPAPPAPKSASFPIVGIGASAGGLEALERFLTHVPEKAEIAFVVVQHLDPTHKGMVPELLQRTTRLEVLQVKDRMPVEPGRVYVIPPNKDLSLLRGRLHLMTPAAPRGLRLPIDSFLRSLADDRQERAIGVILSGMGSDGTAGLRAIKEKAGLALVQDPADARFDAMPRSAIDAGLADIIAPAADLWDRIIAYLGHAPLLSKARTILDTRTQSSLEKIVLLLRQRTGHDFALYKKSTLYRRIERRMGIHQIDRIATYVSYLRDSTAETDLLFKELLIGVTSFFRDPDAWELFKAEALRPLLASRPAGGSFRAWVAGCSTGEEAYSLAIAFKEVAEEMKDGARRTIQVFATDIDGEAIERARQGLFPANIAGEVSPERLHRFFVQEEPGYRVAKEIREMVIFAVQNVIMDPPFTKLDVLSCRNVLIYLESECQKRLMPLFHYSLAPGGILFLGNAETIGAFSDLFVPIGAKARVYRRGDTSARADAMTFPVTQASVEAPDGRHQKGAPLLAPASLQSLVEQLILSRYAPASVLVNGDGDLLFVSGRTGKYLEPAAGRANLNVFGMAREGLRYELAAAFQKARREKGVAKLRGLRVRTNGDFHTVDVTVQAVEEPEGLAGTALIVFEDVAAPPADLVKKVSRTRKASEDTRVLELERALQEARAALQTTREEMQSSQEELKSANEELQSANEELQSTNEELTTSKEEMQSMNEELQTLNAELVAKVEELSRTHDDMKNLLNSTDIATLFLDGDLHVRRFTTPATQLIRLITSDVGRPITDITSRLDYPDLAEDAREVLRTLTSRERPVTAEDGRWFTARIMPYRTADNRIDGVVITFSDVTTAKRLEEKLRRTHADLERQVIERETELADTTARLQERETQGKDP